MSESKKTSTARKSIIELKQKGTNAQCVEKVENQFDVDRGLDLFGRKNE